MKRVTKIAGALLLPAAVLAQNATTVNITSAILSSGTVDLGNWADAYVKATTLVSQVTQAEKISIITGGSVSGSVNWTALEFKDGTQGVQGYDYVTGFGMSSSLANTWHKTLMYNQFKAVALEFYGKGFKVTNAPTSQPLGRIVSGGRNVEALGADPYLNDITFGVGASQVIQRCRNCRRWQALLTERAGNESSSPGNGSSTSDSVAPYSSVVDEKALHESYLWSFYDGVKNGLSAIMCAMTKVNGTLSCENEDLIQGLLKTELCFPGLVFPDVGGQSTAVGSANGGLDYGSSSIWTEATLDAAITNGTFTQARLDDVAVGNVIGYYYVNFGSGTQPAYVSSNADVDVRANHAAIVKENGAASIILLKNINNTLPLKSPLSMALFGAHARPIMAGPNYEFSVAGSGPTYQGHLAGGSGSGQTSFPYLITPQQALTARAAGNGTMIRWIPNNTYTDSISSGVGVAAVASVEARLSVNHLQATLLMPQSALCSSTHCPAKELITHNSGTPNKMSWSSLSPPLAQTPWWLSTLLEL